MVVQPCVPELWDDNQRSQGLPSPPHRHRHLSARRRQCQPKNQESCPSLVEWKQPRLKSSCQNQNCCADNHTDKISLIYSPSGYPTSTSTVTDPFGISGHTCMCVWVWIIDTEGERASGLRLAVACCWLQQLNLRAYLRPPLFGPIASKQRIRWYRWSSLTRVTPKLADRVVGAIRVGFWLHQGKINTSSTSDFNTFVLNWPKGVVGGGLASSFTVQSVQTWRRTRFRGPSF